jgi:hypothetical protein
MGNIVFQHSANGKEKQAAHGGAKRAAQACIPAPARSITAPYNSGHPKP